MGECPGDGELQLTSDTDHLGLSLGFQDQVPLVHLLLGALGSSDGVIIGPAGSTDPLDLDQGVGDIGGLGVLQGR